MERMMILRRALAVVGLLLGVLLLGTCSNPFDLLGVLETEVKIGTGKFLVVESVTPEANQFDVNPGVYIVVVFNQALDESTINSTNIAITPTLGGPAAGWNHDYSEATKTLQIHADPYLENTTKYAVQIGSGLKGSNGSELQYPYTWEFTTGTYPAGTVSFNETDPYSDDPATTSQNVTIYFTGNSVVDNYRYSLISAANLASLAYDQSGASKAAVLPNVDGLYTVWAQWIDKDPAPDEESTVQFDTIYLDRVAPMVEAGTTSPRYINSTISSISTSASASDATSGVETYLWTGAGLTFGTPNALNTTIAASSDNTYTATLRATDYAGNFSTDSITVIRDTVAPVTPIFTASTTASPTFDNTPTWAWVTGGGGSGTFEYWLDKPTTEKPVSTTATSLTISSKTPLEDGTHYMYIRERDAAGNRSENAYRAIIVTPALPLPDSKSVSRFLSSLDWRPSVGSYTVYFGEYGVRPTKYTATTSTLDLTKAFPMGLAPSTTYAWYYYNAGSTRFPTSGSYTFTTAK